jgi:hypothetical protein
LQFPRASSSVSTEVALIAVFTGLSLGTNYAMIGLLNVKLMDSLVFLAAFLFGLRVGIGVAISIWSIYGFVNPWGQADFVTLAFVMSGECLYALAAAILCKTSMSKQLLREGQAYGRVSFVLGIIGLVTTFAYDTLTNFGTYVFKTNSFYQALLIGEITGAPFALPHELSNLVFFAVVAPGAIASARHFSLANGGHWSR